MPRRVIELEKGHPLLDIATYARRGPGARFSPQELELISYTARRTPEVMVKVSGGATNSQGAVAHLKYIDRRGRLEIETDQGEVIRGSNAENSLIADWDLDLVAAESRSPYSGKAGRKAAKLVHNIVLSMPAGTPPAKLLAASREFAREAFALKHRYAMVLHTDQDHPHVHLVVKAVSETGDVPPNEFAERRRAVLDARERGRILQDNLAVFGPTDGGGSMSERAALTVQDRPAAAYANDRRIARNSVGLIASFDRRHDGARGDTAFLSPLCLPGNR